MSEETEKNLNEIELERLILLFDTALTSRDPRVKEALSKLLMIAALIEPDTATANSLMRGPLFRMQQKLNDLSDRIRTIESQLYNTNNTTYTATTSILSPTFSVTLTPNTAPTTGKYVNVSATATATAGSAQIDLFPDTIVKI